MDFTLGVKEIQVNDIKTEYGDIEYGLKNQDEVKLNNLNLDLYFKLRSLYLGVGYGAETFVDFNVDNKDTLAADDIIDSPIQSLSYAYLTAKIDIDLFLFHIYVRGRYGIPSVPEEETSGTNNVGVTVTPDYTYTGERYMSLGVGVKFLILLAELEYSEDYGKLEKNGVEETFSNKKVSLKFGISLNFDSSNSNYGSDLSNNSNNGKTIIIVN